MRRSRGELVGRGLSLQWQLSERAAPQMKFVPFLKPLAGCNAVTLTEGVSAKKRGELPYGDTAGCKKQLPELCLIRDHMQDTTFQAI